MVGSSAIPSSADLALAFAWAGQTGSHADWCRENLSIRDKKGVSVVLDLWPAQRKLDEVIERIQAKRRPVRVIVLKARQVSFSVGVASEFFRRVPFTPGQHCFVVSEKYDSAKNLFDYYQQFQASYRSARQFPLPRLIKNNEERLEWDNASYIQVKTAQAVEVGRSFSLRYLHLSEFSIWPDPATVMTALMQCVPDDEGTMVVVESTAHGVGGEFYDIWKKATDPRGGSEWVPVFFGWNEHPMYRMEFRDERERAELERTLKTEELELRQRHNLTAEQLNWRRWTLENKCQGDPNRFKQEYPACLTGEVRVSTQRGIIPISEGFGADQTESGSIKAWGPQPVSPIYRLTTTRGRSIRGTFDHPVMTEDGNCVYLGQLKPGQRIVLRPPRFADEPYYQQHWQLIPGAGASVVIDEQWGAFLGYFMSNGSWHKNNIEIGCDGKDPDVAEDIDRLMTELIGPPSRRIIQRIQGRKGMIQLRLSSVAARPIFEQLGIIHRNGGGTGSWVRNAHIPECIFRSPEPVVREFLRTLIECDGSASANKVRFCSCKLRVVRDVQLLLLGFGINSTISKETKPAGNGAFYTFYPLSLGVEASRLYHDRIGFVSARKSALRPEETSCGRPPNPNEMIDEVLLVEEQPPEIVYDLTVEPDHLFSANGILTHNTADEAFLTSGRPRFDVRCIERMPSFREPLMGGLEEVAVGTRRSVQFFTREHGEMSLFKRPQAGRGYVIGADIGQGSELIAGDPNFSVAQVLDQDTGEQVAVVRERITPAAFAQYLYDLGRFYNWAYINIEVNIEIGTLEELLRLGYPVHLIYRRQPSPDQQQRGQQGNLGWRTDQVTRPQLVSALDTAIREGSVIPHDPTTIQELRTFVIKASGKAEAQQGTHDDTVIALALAVMALRTAPRDRKILPGGEVVEVIPKVVDYRRTVGGREVRIRL